MVALPHLHWLVHQVSADRLWTNRHPVARSIVETKTRFIGEVVPSHRFLKSFFRRCRTKDFFLEIMLSLPGKFVLFIVCFWIRTSIFHVVSCSWKQPDKPSWLAEIGHFHKNKHMLQSKQTSDTAPNNNIRNLFSTHTYHSCFSSENHLIGSLRDLTSYLFGGLELSTCWTDFFLTMCNERWPEDSNKLFCVVDFVF